MSHLGRTPQPEATAYAVMYVEVGGSLKALDAFVAKLPEAIRITVATLVKGLLEDAEERWNKGTSLGDPD